MISEDSDQTDLSPRWLRKSYCRFCRANGSYPKHRLNDKQKTKCAVVEGDDNKASYTFVTQMNPAVNNVGSSKAGINNACTANPCYNIFVPKDGAIIMNLLSKSLMSRMIFKNGIALFLFPHRTYVLDI